MNGKVITIEIPHTQITLEEKNEYRDFKKNYVWKEDEIPSLRLEKRQGRMRKNKRIIDSYRNEKHHGIKQTNLCKSENSSW